MMVGVVAFYAFRLRLSAVGRRVGFGSLSL